MAPLVILEGDLLQELVRIITLEEEAVIMNIKFRSEYELARYLRICHDNLDCVMKLIKDANDIKEEFKNDETRSSIAHDIYQYIHNSVNFGVQSIRNYTLRQNYLKTISKDANAILEEVRNPDLTVTEIQDLAKKASETRNATLEITRMQQNPVSRSFSKWLKEEGMSFEDLVHRYKVKRGFSEPLEELPDIAKLEVYSDIIEASGRGNIKINRIAKVLRPAGYAVLIFMAAMIVWDIFSSDDKIRTATRDSIEAVASYYGAELGAIVGAALPTLISIEASTTFVLASAIIGSIAGAFLIGAVVGLLFDWIFSSGGRAPLSTEGYIFYVSPMPDGQALARRIAHQHLISN